MPPLNYSLSHVSSPQEWYPPSPNSVFSQFRYNKWVSNLPSAGADCPARIVSDISLHLLECLPAILNGLRREGPPSWLPTKDTEAAVGDVQVPEVDPQVIGWHVGLVVGVDRDGVDVVGVGVGEHSPGAHLHHQVHGLQHRNLENSSQTVEWQQQRRGQFQSPRLYLLHP